MVENETDYINDIVAIEKPKIKVQGYTLTVDPDLFSVRDEITIRQAFKDEGSILRGGTPTDPQSWNETVMAAREVILACGETLIPKLCPEWTPADVGDRLDIQAIAATLGFFLRPDWRQSQITLMDPTPTTSDPATPTLTIPAAPSPGKKRK